MSTEEATELSPSSKSLAFEALNFRVTGIFAQQSTSDELEQLIKEKQLTHFPSFVQITYVDESKR